MPSMTKRAMQSVIIYPFMAKEQNHNVLLSVMILSQKLEETQSRMVS
jgi:hypothetical protein